MTQTTPKEIETLFYFLDGSVLKGNLGNSKMFLKILRNEWEENEENFEILGDRIEYLTDLGKVIDKGLVVRSFDIGKVNDLIIKKDDFQVAKEKILSQMLCKNQEILKNALKASDDFQIATERQRVTFGEVDLIAYDKDICYVIELKKEEVRHDIIGQIEKYMFDFKLKLIYKLWNEVKGVVIGNSYSKYALKELSKANIICMKYVFKDDNLRLEVL